MTTITSTPGVQGGEPCVAGTRTPVRSIVVSYWHLHSQNLTATQASFSHLTLEQIIAALDYYQDHKVRMDALIEDQELALWELQRSTDSIIARLKADARCERIALFLCTTEGDLGESGEAVNERGELVGWWLYPNGRLSIRPYQVDELDPAVLTEPEYQRARAEVGLPAVLS